MNIHHPAPIEDALNFVMRGMSNYAKVHKTTQIRVVVWRIFLNGRYNFIYRWKYFKLFIKQFIFLQQSKWLNNNFLFLWLSFLKWFLQQKTNRFIGKLSCLSSSIRCLGFAIYSSQKFKKKTTLNWYAWFDQSERVVKLRIFMN